MGRYGTSISELHNFEFASIEELEAVDVSTLMTCRGVANEQELKRGLSLILDEDADYDERLDAICEVLWDKVVHQYTFYSVTPVFLYWVLSETDRFQRARISDIRHFVEICWRSGNRTMALNESDVERHEAGKLLIFDIKEIILKFA